MATTVHIPADLLARVDARAKALGISRNRFIVSALRDNLTPSAQWPPELVQMLDRPARAELSAAVDDMVDAIKSTRRSRKRRPKL